MHDDGDYGDEDDTSDDDSFDDSGDDGDDEDRFRWLGRTTERATRRLGLNYAARMLSLLIAKGTFHMEELRDESRLAKAVMFDFVASHLVGHPLTLGQVSMLLEISQHSILHTYRLFYPQCETVVDGEFLFLLGENAQRARTGNLPSLAWPPPAYDEELCTDAFWETIASRLRIEPEHSLILMEVSRALVPRLVRRTYLIGKSSMEIAALCMYLASYLKDISISCGEIASATGTSEGNIHTLYARFYPHRQDLVQRRAFNRLRRAESFERRIGSLPREMQSSVA